MTIFLDKRQDICYSGNIIKETETVMAKKNKIKKIKKVSSLELNIMASKQGARALNLAAFAANGGAVGSKRGKKGYNRRKAQAQSRREEY